MLMQAPARLAAFLLPQGLQLEALSGTLWQGSAARGTLWVNAQALSLGRVTWRVSPWSVLVLRPSVEVTSEWGGQRLRSAVSFNGPGRLNIEPLQAQFEIAFIRKMLPLYVGGRINLDFSHLTLEGGRVQSGDGRVQWRDAVWTANSGDVPLGHYSVALSGHAGELSGRVETVSGPLQVSGDLKLMANRYSIDLALSGPATANRALGDALRLLAQPSATGFAMVLSGEL